MVVTRVQSNMQVYNCRDEKLEGTKCSGEKLNKVGDQFESFLRSHMYSHLCLLRWEPFTTDTSKP